MPIEAPHFLPRTAESRLHLVGNVDAACFSDLMDGIGEKSRLPREHAVARKNAVRYKPGNANPLDIHRCDRGPHVLCKPVRHIPRISAVGIRRGHYNT